MVLPRNIEMSAQLCIEQHIREFRHQELSYHNLTNRLNQVLCYSSGLKIGQTCRNRSSTQRVERNIHQLGGLEVLEGK